MLMNVITVGVMGHPSRGPMSALGTHCVQHLDPHPHGVSIECTQTFMSRMFAALLKLLEHVSHSPMSAA